MYTLVEWYYSLYEKIKPIWKRDLWMGPMNEKRRTIILQPIAYGASFPHSQISIVVLVLSVSFATFHWKETHQIEIGYSDRKVLLWRHLAKKRFHPDSKRLMNETYTRLLNETNVKRDYKLDMHMWKEAYLALPGWHFIDFLMKTVPSKTSKWKETYESDLWHEKRPMDEMPCSDGFSSW